MLGGGGGGGGRSAYTTRDQFPQSFVHNSFCVDSLPDHFGFRGLSVRTANSVPGLTQDGSLRHILSVSQPAEDILQHFELR